MRALRFGAHMRATNTEHPRDVKVATHKRAKRARAAKGGPGYGAACGPISRKQNAEGGTRTPDPARMKRLL